MFQRWYCISESLSDLLRFHFFNSVFSKWRRTLNLILSIEKELCARIPANILLARSQSWGCQILYATSLPDVREKKNNKKPLKTHKHTKYPPKQIKMGKEMQAPTLNHLSVYLPPAPLPTSFALWGGKGWVSTGWAKAGSLCFVMSFQLREGMRNKSILAKAGHLKQQWVSTANWGERELCLCVVFGP